MKVLVSFEPRLSHDNFEGTRLRKTIKGGLEMHDIKYTSNILDEYDVAHFISCEDELKINEIKEKNVPVVVSALYCEDDPVASFLDFKNKDGERIITLKSKGLRVLNKADLVLVPTETARDFLLNNGVTSPIQVCRTCVNLARFDFSREDEKEIFYRYFGEDKNKKLVLTLGDYGGNLDGINSLIHVAKKNPNAIFYFFGSNDKYAKTLRVRRYIHAAPKNVRFKGLLPDDVYRSALMNASLYLVTKYGPSGVVGITDAMAAKCQIISRKTPLFSELFTDGENAYLAEYSETITSLIKDFLDGKLKPTIENAHKEISQYDLSYFGERLIWFYTQLINKNKF